MGLGVRLEGESLVLGLARLEAVPGELCHGLVDPLNTTGLSTQCVEVLFRHRPQHSSCALKILSPLLVISLLSPPSVCTGQSYYLLCQGWRQRVQ